MQYMLMHAESMINVHIFDVIKKNLISFIIILKISFYVFYFISVIVE